MQHLAVPISIVWSMDLTKHSRDNVGYLPKTLAVPIRFNVMTITVLCLWQVADIISAVCRQIHGSNDTGSYSQFIQFGTTEMLHNSQWIMKDSKLLIFASHVRVQVHVCVRTNTHIHEWMCVCVSLLACLGYHNVRTNTHIHEWMCVCVSLLACLGYHNVRVQDAPTNYLNCDFARFGEWPHSAKAFSASFYKMAWQICIINGFDALVAN